MLGSSSLAPQRAWVGSPLFPLLRLSGAGLNNVVRSPAIFLVCVSLRLSFLVSVGEHTPVVRAASSPPDRAFISRPAGPEAPVVQSAVGAVGCQVMSFSSAVADSPGSVGSS